MKEKEECEIIELIDAKESMKIIRINESFITEKLHWTNILWIVIPILLIILVGYSLYRVNELKNMERELATCLFANRFQENFQYDGEDVSSDYLGGINDQNKIRNFVIRCYKVCLFLNN
uniref:Uncharacterized protein n=1 Tax=Clytia hemisphaerica TaxID=252671 RepID=A0A7M5X127_9CNID|eukprot:TCONS_00022089-protein